MVLGHEFYQEIARLGQKPDNQTYLVRDPEGRIMVCKGLESEVIPVYRKLQAANIPGTARIFGFCIYKGQESAVMEYIPSATLEEKLLQSGKLSVKETRKIALEICQVLFELEKLGIVHRDLSPSNILIAPDGKVIVTDFGISREVKSGQSRDTTILGTAGYAAPEQFGFAQTDTRADIYSLGVLVNQMLTGKLPQEELYQGDTMLSALVKGCIQLSPKERWELGRIEEVLAGKRFRKKLSVKRLISWIPGFRTGNPVHMTLASVEYIFMTLFFLSILFRPIDHWPQVLVRLAGYLLNTLGLGLLAGEFKAIAYRLHMDHGIRKGILFVLTAILWSWLYCCGMTWMWA